MLWLVSLTAGCGTARENVGNEFCYLARPMYFSPDSKLTIPDMRQVIAHNELGARLCDWPGADD